MRTFFLKKILNFLTEAESPVRAEARNRPSKFYGLEYIESENIVTGVNNVYLNGVRIAAVAENGALAYYLTDQVDSVSHVLDDDANTLSKMQYQPYGETFVHKGDTDFAPKYNSQELDRESGFYFYNARYYDPGIARFTSADTVIDGEWDTQGWNRFSYVKGNPIGAKDPSGHEANGGIGTMINSQCKGNASCNSAGLNSVSQGAKSAVVGTVATASAVATGYIATAELGAAALPSAIYLSSRFAKPNVTNSLLNLLPRSQNSVSNAINATKESLKKTSSASIDNKGNNPSNLAQPAKTIVISKSRYPESAKHIDDAQKSGKPSILTIDRAGAKERRRESLRG
ncbi:hypothetical protein EHQ97_13240 [Leptospira adleri]|nr:hypothetical protein EHQ97_13240 [Leptospira adleri]